MCILTSSVWVERGGTEKQNRFLPVLMQAFVYLSDLLLTKTMLFTVAVTVTEQYVACSSGCIWWQTDLTMVKVQCVAETGRIWHRWLCMGKHVTVSGNCWTVVRLSVRPLTTNSHRLAPTHTNTPAALQHVCCDLSQAKSMSVSVRKLKRVKLASLQSDYLHKLLVCVCLTSSRASSWLM